MAANQKRLECPVCLEQFKSNLRIPKCLPCLHSICLPCLRNIAGQFDVSCPICRAKHFPPNRDPAQFPANPILMELIEEQEQDDMRSKLKECSSLIDDRIDKLTSDLDNLRKASQDFRLSTIKAEDHVKRMFIHSISQLERRQDTLISEIRSQRKQLTTDLVSKAQTKLDEAIALGLERQTLVDMKSVERALYRKFETRLSDMTSGSNLTNGVKLPGIMDVRIDTTTSLEDIETLGDIMVDNVKVSC